MKYTENYNLKKPELSDIANVLDFGENFDVIDEKLKELEDTEIEIVDNLESTATNKALSANQGRVLKGMIEEVKYIKHNFDTFSVVEASNDIFTLDLSENINFKIELDDGEDKSIAFSNIPQTDNLILNVSIMVICKEECDLAFPESVIWQNDIPPAFVERNKYILMFSSYNKGETWEGSWVGAWAFPLEVIVFDDFNREDDPTSLGDAVTGQTWEYASQDEVWAIVNNQAVQTGTMDETLAYINSGVSDCIISVKFMDVTPEKCYLIFRAFGTSDCYYVTRGSDPSNNQWVIGKIVGGYETTWTEKISTVHASGDVVKVVLRGGSIRLYVNDKFVMSITDEFNKAATIHGIGTYMSKTSAFDDFKVEVWKYESAIISL